jgi:ASC-1-like (ASCH) protein
MIKSKEKMYEGRLVTKIDEWNLEGGSRIKFYDEDNVESWVLVEVTELLIFDSFGSAFAWLGSKLIPGETSKDEVIDLYNELFHYPDEELVKGKTSKMILDNGAMAIGFKIVGMNSV